MSSNNCLSSPVFFLPSTLKANVCSCGFFVFQRKNVHLLLSVLLLAAWGAFLLACRFYWMGNKPPNFSNSDNPAADCPSLLTRALTFFYLPAINFWLLLFPDTLSFDWSMDALPLIRSLADWRNCHTLFFYLGLLSLAWFGLWVHQHAVKGKDVNGKAHHYTNGRNGSSNGHSYQCNGYNHTNNSHADTQITGAQNGTKNHYESRSPLPTSENVVVFSLGLLTIPFLPATNVFFYVGFVIAERLLYIPSMGFCLLVAVGMRSLYIRLQRRSFKTMLVYCSASLVLLFGVKTVLRNRDWQNEEMLYRSGILVNPAKGEKASLYLESMRFSLLGVSMHCIAASTNQTSFTIQGLCRVLWKKNTAESLSLFDSSTLSV